MCSMLMRLTEEEGARGAGEVVQRRPHDKTMEGQPKNVRYPSDSGEHEGRVGHNAGSSAQDPRGGGPITLCNVEACRVL